MNKAALQLPRDIRPGISIISAAFTPERSTLSKRPSSMRKAAQVWQWPSVGGCSPSESTHGQNTVHEHDSTNSPFNDHCSTLHSLHGWRAKARPSKAGDTRRQYCNADHDKDHAQDA